jgi:hypothetical protein
MIQTSTVARRARKNVPRDAIAHKLCGLGVNHETHPAGTAIVHTAGRPTQSKVHLPFKYPLPFYLSLVWADIH